MSIDKKLEYIKMLDKLSETFGESEGQTPDEVRNELREEGFDIDSAELRLMDFQKKIEMSALTQPLDEAKMEREQNENKYNEIYERLKSWTNEQVIERIKELAQKNPDLSIAYREYNSEKHSQIDDVREILIDIMIAESIHKEDENGSV
jgi:hypothetical protein